jgi:2-hydroxy-3-oxopropionate reductase
MNIGFIGTGIMGRPMALNLMNAGHELSVYGRRFDTVEPLLVAGALGKGTPSDLASVSDVIFTVVHDTKDVEEVILGNRGIIHGARPGSIVVDMSTISPSATRQIAQQLEERGVEMLDAPVSGGETGAKTGTLSIMVGGKKEVFDRIKPLLDILGKNIVHVGDHGAGQVVKACNQIVVSLTFEGVAEAILLARRNGVDPAKMREALMGGFAGSRILEVHGQRMLEANYKAGFKVKLHNKDMKIVLDNMVEVGLNLPGVSLFAEQIGKLMDAGDSELDSSAIMLALERENEGGKKS